jgi:hypothetical protein
MQRRATGFWTTAAAAAGVDRVVAYGLLTRLWQAAGGAVSLLLISHYFSPELQGYYYTFLSLLALQAFFELGLYLVVINTASHEWAHLSLSARNTVEGDSVHISRLASLVRFVLAWYSAAALLFVVFVGIGGAWFFSRHDIHSLVWQPQWIALVVVFSVTLVSSAMLTLLEGCNQVLEVNRTRLRSAVASALLLWAAILGGLGLWASLVSPLVSLAFAASLLFGKYRHFLRALVATRSGANVDWRHEIWPMQWRLALQGLTNYFSYSLNVPVMFHFWGATVAGQMGMTLQVVAMLQLVAQAWLQARIPQFGIHIARHDYNSLDRIWRQTSVQSIGVALSAGTALWLAILVLDMTGARLASRVLEPFLVALLVIHTVLSQFVQCAVAYVRAHKREMFTLVGVSSGALTGVLILWWGAIWGASGAVWATLLVLALYSTPLVTLIWLKADYK